MCIYGYFNGGSHHAHTGGSIDRIYRIRRHIIDNIYFPCDQSGHTGRCFRIRNKFYTLCSRLISPEAVVTLQHIFFRRVLCQLIRAGTDGSSLKGFISDFFNIILRYNACSPDRAQSLFKRSIRFFSLNCTVRSSIFRRNPVFHIILQWFHLHSRLKFDQM